MLTIEARLKLALHNALLKMGQDIPEDKIVIELKSVEILQPIHSAQLMTYLKLSQKQLGLLINFNVTNLQNGIRRYKI